MSKLNREDIYTINHHSNWPEASVKKALTDEVYNDTASWYKFLRLLFLSLGVAFSTVGIIFFFAYNWNDLDKFLKIGLIEGLLVVMVLIVLLTKVNERTKNILLAGASMLVGILFAVFGQVYQTGANAYDFFMGWTMAVTLWVVVSNFAVLWLVFIVLVNTTFVMYAQQVAYDWSYMLVLTVTLGFNALVLLFFLAVPKFIKSFQVPTWFENSLALAVICLSTSLMVSGIFDSFYEDEISFLPVALLTVMLYVAGIIYGLKTKRSFYLSIIPFSIIIIISSMLVKEMDDIDVLLLLSIFVIGSVTGVIKGLLSIQKKWKNEE